MDLPEALRSQKENFLNSAPKEVVTVMKDATESLSNSGIISNCLKSGDRAIDFTLNDVNNMSVNLQKHLEQGPVVLKFFRGDW